MWVRRSALITCLTAAISAGMVAAAVGLTGDLDQSFNGSGQRVIDFGGTSDAADTVLVRQRHDQRPRRQ